MWMQGSPRAVVGAGHIYNFICVYPLSMFYTIFLYVCIYAAYCFVATHCMRNDLCPLARSCAGLLPILEPPLRQYASGNEWSSKDWMSVYLTIRCFWMFFCMACALFGVPNKTGWDCKMSTHKWPLVLLTYLLARVTPCWNFNCDGFCCSKSHRVRFNTEHTWMCTARNSACQNDPSPEGMRSVFP